MIPFLLIQMSSGEGSTSVPIRIPIQSDSRLFVIQQDNRVIVVEKDG
jgi:hypothetical protein